MASGERISPEPQLPSELVRVPLPWPAEDYGIPELLEKPVMTSGAFLERWNESSLEEQSEIKNLMISHAQDVYEQRRNNKSP